MRYLLFIFCFAVLTTHAQELDCKVTLNVQKMNVNDAKILKTLEQTLNEFMNNKRWTNDAFKPQEKIECSIVFTVDVKQAENKYTGTLTIQSSRPVFNSDYKTNMLNYKDRNLSFTYKEFDPIEFNENAFNGSLASAFAFYAYIIIGLDYDSYAPLGGTQYFNKAENIVLQVPMGEPGWSAENKDLNDRTRGNLVTEIQNSRYKTFREGWYTYHLKGLDIMYGDPVLARTNMSSVIQNMNKLNTDFTNTMVMLVFNQAKSNEIANFFDGAPKMERENILRTMIRMDQSNSQRFQQLLQKSGSK